MFAAMPSDEEIAATVEERARQGSASQDLDASDLPRGWTIGRYVVIDKVGQGGMGVVYAAYDHILDRRVALKLVTSRSPRDAAALLLAEARAMAQLSHPAIVPVHDIGEFRGQVFLAMAFVDGTTLRAWQARGERPWREAVDMYRVLGEGLAFAHDEGIIHRDFKPDNVLVDAEGRPHITDFGLAKIVLASEGDAQPAASPHTITGRVAGTFGYMSPEQSRGDPTDARTDQYAFCVSLFEALHGGKPGDEPPARAEVPRRVLAAIERGLADDPAERWPSMRALLGALAPPRSGRRARVLVGATASVVALLAVGATLHHGSHAASCEIHKATASWQPRRAEVVAAFAARGKSGAELVEALDSWTARWNDMAQESCHATADGSQSSQLLDLRAHCLDHALDVTTSLIDLGSRGDPDLLRHTASVADRLPSLEPCADTSGLLGLPPLPADPVQRAAIAALERQLARVQALQVGESFRAASDLLDSLAEPVKGTGYAPLAFELYNTRSSVEIAKQADPEAAAAAAWAAIGADPGRQDLQTAGVWIDLVWIVGVMQHAPTQAIEIGHIAEAIEARVQDKHQLALLDHRLATVLVAAGKFDEATARYERAIAGFAAQGDVYDQIAAIGGEAMACGQHNKPIEQLALLERAIALASKLPHSQLLLADLLSEISIAHMEAGRYADARAALERALVAIGDGSDTPALLAAIHGNLGNVADREGDLATAEREYRTELELARDKLGADVSDAQIAWYNLGQIQLQRHELADALASLHHALDILQRSPPAAAESADYAGPGELARHLVTTQVALGHAADAVADVEACLALAERDGVQPGTLADVHYSLATATWETGDRARARAIMRIAATEYHAAHAESDEADGWLAAH
jgi:serine/threonine protein kinase/tetratricopeptide (TPR) repeat protein